MDSGSWSDAEDYCNIGKGHLWSINSYFEWWTLYNSFEIKAFTKTQHGRGLNTDFHYLLSTVLLFIGLQANKDDSTKVIKQWSF